MAKKRRTAAQIRATKKLVAMNKARANGSRRKRAKAFGRKNAAGPRKTHYVVRKADPSEDYAYEVIEKQGRNETLFGRYERKADAMDAAREENRKVSARRNAAGPRKNPLRVVSRDFFATRKAAQQYKRKLLPGLHGKITRDKDGTWLVEVTSPYPDPYEPRRYPLSSHTYKTNAAGPRGPTLTMAQGRKLYEMGKRAPKTPIAMKMNGRKVSIVTGKAARRLASKGR